MKFIHITDLHLVPPGELLWGLDPFERFDACLNDIAAHHGDAAFCAITGDLTEMGAPEAYALLRDRLARFPLPTHLMIGNHDDRGNYLAAFGGADQNGYVQSSLVLGGNHFLFLDTLKGAPSSAGLYDAPRKQWLKARLAEAAENPVYLFMHHPPFDIGHQLMDLIKLEDAQDFENLLKDSDVRHLFFGHAHRTMSGMWNGIPFSAIPGVNHQLPLVRDSVPTVYSNEPPMYSVVLVGKGRTVVHSDAFLNRAPADMPLDVERENWV
jgi:3',5'-cyclic AMP phosphodiesterase CpdA